MRLARLKVGDIQARIRADVPIIAYGLVLFIFATFLYRLIGPGQVPSEVQLLPTALLVFLSFTTEAKALHIELRKQSHSLSLSAVPLVVGLIWVAPLGLIIARVLGNALALGFLRRQPPVKLFWNTGLVTAETTVALVVAGTVLNGSDPDQFRQWLVIALALGLAELLGLVAVPGVIMVAEKEFRPELFRQIGRSQMIAAVGATFSIVLAAAMLQTPLLAIMGAIPIIGISTLLQIHGRLSREHHDLQYLHGFASALSGTDSLDAGLKQLGNILHARGAALAVVTKDDQISIRALIDGEFQDLAMPRDGTTLGPWSAGVYDAGVRSVQHLETAVAEKLGASQALWTGVLKVGPEPGILMVFDRLGMNSVFDEQQQALLTSMDATFDSTLSADRLLRQLEQRAKFDELTGLANRGTLEEFLFNRLHDDGRAGAVLIFDLNRFKEVNDTLGHQFGDQLLQAIGERLSSIVRDSDQVARLGGDEFAVILDEVHDHEALTKRLDQLADELSRPVELDGLALDVSVSIGVAHFPKDGRIPADLLRRADVAMYESKRTQQDWVAYNPKYDTSSPRRLKLANDIKPAIENGELTIYLQPQLTTVGQVLVGAEALVRWHHPELGMIPPLEFLDLVANGAQAAAFTRLVIRSSLDAYLEIAERGIDLPISVNLMSRDVLDRRLPQFVTEELAKRNLPGRVLCLEVTEHSLVVDLDGAIVQLQAFRDLGCRISIDDYGTGYSSLQYLQRLPTDEVKIDQSFVRDILTDSDARAIVKSTILLVHELGLEAVAEGIEDEETLELLAELKCDVGQGYLFARPLPLSEFHEWMDKAQTLPLPETIRERLNDRSADIDVAK